MQQKASIFERSRLNMVKNQLMTLDVHNQKLLESFLHVPRELFVSDINKETCYVDCSMYEPENLMLRPEILFKALNKLQISKQYSVLVANAGLGYVPCILSQLGCKVLAVETDKNSLTHISHNIAYLKIKNVDVRAIDISQTFLEEAPFNSIFINRVIDGKVPELILSQLADGGRLVAIIKNKRGEEKICLFTKFGNGTIQEQLVL